MGSVPHWLYTHAASFGYGRLKVQISFHSRPAPKWTGLTRAGHLFNVDRMVDETVQVYDRPGDTDRGVDTDRHAVPD